MNRETACTKFFERPWERKNEKEKGKEKKNKIWKGRKTKEYEQNKNWAKIKICKYLF